MKKILFGNSVAKRMRVQRKSRRLKNKSSRRLKNKSSRRKSSRRLKNL